MLGCVLILVNDIYAFLWLFAITFRVSRAFLYYIVLIPIKCIHDAKEKLTLKLG